MSIYKITDLVSLAISFLLAYLLRLGAGPIQPLEFYIPFVLGSIVIAYFSFAIFSLYGKDEMPFSLVYLENLLKAWFFWGACIGIFAFFSKAEYSRAMLVFFFLCYGPILYITRFGIEWRRAAKHSFEHDPKISRDIKELVRVSRLSSENLSVLEGLPLRKASGKFYEPGKRILDILFSALTLFLLLPLLVFIACKIRSNSAGPILINQERVGRGGRKFLFFKFRTMYKNVPLYAPAPRRDDDPRVTSSGRILRKYSLDELPQLWNVLKGDMSLVGPRPEMPFIVEKYEPWQRARLEVKPGITGLWQIFGRKDRPLEENIEYDFYYLYHRSFFLDLAIILKTIPHLIFPKGAY